MDWPVTARTTVPHVRQTVADRELETWLVVDLSPSLDFGTARTEKRELVLAAITAVGAPDRARRQPGRRARQQRRSRPIADARAGRHAPTRRYLMRRIAATPRADAGRRRGDLAAMLETLRRPPRRRGLVAVVSDFLDGRCPAPGRRAAPPWERALRALAPQHQLLGVEVLDPRELELPNAGLVTFVDTETGRAGRGADRRPYRPRQLRRRGRAQRERIATSLRHAGAAHLQLRTDRDWVPDVVRFVIARRHTVTGSDRAGAR